MPINSCSDGDKPGYKWGDAGKCYIYDPNSDSSKTSAKKKALAQGVAIGDIDVKYLKKELELLNSVTTESMGSGIKNPEQGAGGRYRSKKPRMVDEEELDEILKNLKEWFKEKWVDISRPKPGGGFEPCGRSDADRGKYPKCVPASRAARMSQEEIASAVRRKRRAESTETREDKKPIYVSTEKAESVNVPTNPALYARVKAEAKRKFNVYPSAYANAWLVREYKKRGGGYRTVTKGDFMDKMAEDLTEDEAMLADSLVAIAEKYGKFDEDGSGIWWVTNQPKRMMIKKLEFIVRIAFFIKAMACARFLLCKSKILASADLLSSLTVLLFQKWKTRTSQNTRMKVKMVLCQC